MSEKKNIKCVYWFSPQIMSKTFLILRRFQRDTIENVQRSSCESTRYFCHILMALDFSRQILEKSLNMKFHENPSVGNRVVLCGQTETDMTKPTAAFRNSAKAPKNYTFCPQSVFMCLYEIQPYTDLTKWFL